MPGGRDPRPTRWEFVQYRYVQVAVDRHGRRTGNRRGRHDQHIGGRSVTVLVTQGGPLLDAEPVLLVNHHHTQGAELHALLDDGVGADEHVHSPGQQLASDPSPFAGRGMAGQQVDLQGSVAEQGRRIGDRHLVEQTGDRGVVLLGEDLRGNHDGRLVPSLHGGQHRRHGHHGLPGADVSLEEPVHGGRPGQVGEDLAHDPVLCSSHPESQPGTELVQERRHPHVVRDADRGALQVHLALDEGQLDAQEFVEHEAATGLAHLVERPGSVDGLIGLGPPHKAVALAHRSGQRIGEPPHLHHPSQGLGHDAVDVPTVQAGRLGLGIDGDDPPCPVSDEVHHRVRHLEVALIAVQPAEHDGLHAHLQLVGAPWLVEEGQAKLAGVVRYPGFHQGTAVPGPSGRDRPDANEDHPLIADRQPTDGGLPGPVQVPAGVEAE